MSTMSWRGRGPVTAALAVCLAGLAIGSLGAFTRAGSEGPGRRVFDEFPGAVSPDGRFITYTEWSTGDLALRDLESGETRHLTHKGTWEIPDFAQAVQAVSPDGRSVAYGWQGPTTCDLRVVELDGSEPRILHRAEHVAHVLPKDWSRDGAQILAVFALDDGSEQMVSIAVADGAVGVLKTFAAGPGMGAGHMMAFSPDGRFVAYDARADLDSPARHLHILAVDGSADLALVEHAANEYVLGWPAEAASVYFASDRSGTLDVWAVPVREGRPDGAPRRIRANLPATEWALFTRDGDLFYERILWENAVYLTEVDSDTGRSSALRRVIDHVSFKTSAEWSPDGRWIAYALGRGRPPDPFVLGIRSLETGQERRFVLDLERLGGHAFDPHWSPDGTMLLGSGRQGIYRIDPDTGAERLMVGSPGGCPGGGECIEWPVWASTDQTVFARFDERLAPRRIAMRNLQTHEEQELYRVRPPAAVSQLAASPDGSRLVFVETGVDPDVSSLKMMATAPGGAVRELVTVPPLARRVAGLDTRKGRILRPAWSPDGSTVFYATLDIVDGDGGFQLWKVSAGGGRPARLGLAVKGLRPYGLSVHPGGRAIALTAGTPRRQETWVIDGLGRELPEPAGT